MKKYALASSFTLIALLSLSSSILKADELKPFSLICLPSQDHPGSFLCSQQGLNLPEQTSSANPTTQTNPTVTILNSDDDQGVSVHGGERAKISGVLFGIDAGISYQSADSYSNRSAPGALLGLRLGYQVAFTKYIGMRFYLSDSFSVGPEWMINSLLANIDFYYNFTRKWGLYVGGGSGVQTVFDGLSRPSSITSNNGFTISFSGLNGFSNANQIQNRNSFIYTGNFGIEYLPGKKVGKNIISLGVTVVSPVLVSYTNSDNSVVLGNYIYTFGYTHVF
ncbi:hypothetical protein [Helicobacter sp. 11S02629-2]|uniref:hypothetical protein n=1 Tax=Helicobacter sp. 11S02629-2 TaxID=1476195 RepID=UPI000BA502E1|nr:hypothetical protein [Helicobacter sp. 11S02629-2]PAF45937.1 hypothetical protein BKH40_00555 [Helicobacter sp. 11S02629-2]